MFGNLLLCKQCRSDILMHNSWGLNYFAKYFLVKADELVEVKFVELLSLSNLLPKHTVHRKSEIPNVYGGNMFPKLYL